MTPTVKQIKAARVSAKLTQPHAAALIHSTKRTWQDWEGDKALMHAGLWQLFNLKLSRQVPRSWSGWSGTPPEHDQIAAARQAANLTQTAAAELIGSTKRTWQDWEANIAKMHPGLWELFLHKTGLGERFLSLTSAQE